MGPRRHTARVSCGTSTTARHRAAERWSLTWPFLGLHLRSAISVDVFGRINRHQVAVLVWPMSLNWWPRPHVASGVIPTTLVVITDYSQMGFVIFLFRGGLRCESTSSPDRNVTRTRRRQLRPRPPSYQERTGRTSRRRPHGKLRDRRPHDAESSTR